MIVLGVAVVAALEIVAIRLDVGHLRPSSNRTLTRSQPGFYRLDDTDRDLVLDREDIFRLAVVTFGPELVSALHLGQLRGDAEPVARKPHAALENLANR